MTIQTDFLHLFHGMDEKTNEAFFQYHADHPQVYKLFKQITFEAIEKGYKHFGSKGIFELMRWQTKGSIKEDGFKLNNTFTPYYARLFANEFPHHNKFFRTRKVKQEIT